MTISTHRHNPTWCGEELHAFFLTHAKPDQELQEALEDSRKRVLEFSLSPGRVSAKVDSYQGKLVKVDIFFSAFTEEAWEQVLERIAYNSLIVSCLITRSIPEGLERTLNDLGLSLFPQSPKDISFRIEGIESTLSAPEAQGLIQRLVDRIREEPLLCLELRGVTEQSLLASLRQKRASLQKHTPHRGSAHYQAVHYDTSEELSKTLDRFWSAGKSLSTMNFMIRADELPASILKRLDALPLRGLEEDIEYQLEQAYAQVARRAQAYGFGLD